MDTKGLQKEFISWCKSKNKLPKSEDETKQLFVTFMKEKHPEEYKQAVQNQQKQQQAQAKKAAHGTKLTYFKSLKNQCAEDEEVVYFKKGGSVKCGCKKKEDGGEIAKAQKGSAVDKFKNRKKEIKQEPPKQDLAARDSIRINSVKGDDELEATRPGNYKPNPKHNPKDPNSRTHIWVPDRTKEPYNKDKKDKVKKDCGGSAIKKFKMHRQGGSLNGIPFYLGGTSKEGILMNKYKNPEIQYSHLNNGRNPMWYRFPYPNQNYILSDNDLGKPGEGVVFVRDERTPGSYLGGTNGGWDPIKRKKRFGTPKKFVGSLFNTWEAFADSVRNANGFKPAQNRKVK